MKRNSLITVFVAISLIALSACSAAPASTSPSNDNTNSSTAVSTALPATAQITENNSPASGTSSLACENGEASAAVTLEQTEGPYFTANSPERASLLEDGTISTTLVISGTVYDSNCKPVANALLDFWQADANGVYDNNGYNFRGHQFTDASGHYQLTTVVPGIYTGRTEHIHFKVQAPDGKLLTSQLYFPGVSQNDSDGIFDPSLLLTVQESSTGVQAQFNFVVP